MHFNRFHPSLLHRFGDVVECERISQEISKRGGRKKENHAKNEIKTDQNACDLAFGARRWRLGRGERSTQLGWLVYKKERKSGERNSRFIGGRYNIGAIKERNEREIGEGDSCRVRSHLGFAAGNRPCTSPLTPSLLLSARLQIQKGKGNTKERDMGRIFIESSTNQGGAKTRERIRECILEISSQRNVCTFPSDTPSEGIVQQHPLPSLPETPFDLSLSPHHLYRAHGIIWPRRFGESRREGSFREICGRQRLERISLTSERVVWGRGGIACESMCLMSCTRGGDFGACRTLLSLVSRHLRAREAAEICGEFSVSWLPLPGSRTFSSKSESGEGTVRREGTLTDVSTHTPGQDTDNSTNVVF